MNNIDMELLDNILSFSEMMLIITLLNHEDENQCE